MVVTFGNTDNTTGCRASELTSISWHILNRMVLVIMTLFSERQEFNFKILWRWTSHFKGPFHYLTLHCLQLTLCSSEWGMEWCWTINLFVREICITELCQGKTTRRNTRHAVMLDAYSRNVWTVWSHILATTEFRTFFSYIFCKGMRSDSYKWNVIAVGLYMIFLVFL